jgi:hypothetical protein
MRGDLPPLPIRLHGVVLKYRDTCYSIISALIACWFDLINIAPCGLIKVSRSLSVGGSFCFCMPRYKHHCGFNLVSIVES